MMDTDIPLISIIVPVYNVSPYLSKCLDSIINQTYQKLEIILIDDGSTDNSGQICDEYAEKDSRIVVVHNENQGTAWARNTGIALAKGSYVMFVDSDDWVDLRICESLFSAIKTYNVHSAMCAYVREYPDNSLPKVLHSENMVFNGREMQRILCGPLGEELSRPETLDCYSTMCGRLYPYEAMQNLMVEDLKLIGTSEDTLFNLEVFAHIESAVYVNQPFYHYRKVSNRSITSRYKQDLENQWSNLYEKMTNVIRCNKLDETCDVALRNRIAINILGVGLNCIMGDASISEKYKRVKKALLNPQRYQALKQLQLKYMPIHWKLFFFSAKHKITVVFFVLLMILNKLRGKV